MAQHPLHQQLPPMVALYSKLQFFFETIAVHGEMGLSSESETMILYYESILWNYKSELCTVKWENIFNCCTPALCRCISQSQPIYCLPILTHPCHVLHPLPRSLPDWHQLHSSGIPRKEKTWTRMYLFSPVLYAEHEHGGAPSANWSGSASQSGAITCPAPQRL